MLSVTQVISPYNDFSGIPGHVLEHAAKRGTIVHQACSCYIDGVWQGRLPVDCEGYFDSFRNWFDKTVKQSIWNERKLIDKKLQFSGTPDLYCEMIDGQRMIVDFKTPVNFNPAWALQLSAYYHLAIKCRAGKPDGCMSLRLRADGKEAIAKTYNYIDDHFAIFLCALNVRRYFENV